MLEGEFAVNELHFLERLGKAHEQVAKLVVVKEIVIELNRLDVLCLSSR